MSEKLTCIAIDDEPIALELMVDYIGAIPFLELANSFSDPMQALAFVQSKPVDLIFIDINMPGLSGIQFLKSLSRKPLCILTTAYSEYAIESYSLSVIDYLLKPIEFDRFVVASNKALQQYKLEKGTPLLATEATPEFVHFKSGTKTHQVRLDDIVYVEASGNYCTIHTINQKIMTLLSMSEATSMLPTSMFIRIHRSFTVGLRHISHAENHQVLIGDRTISISQTYRSSFHLAFIGIKK